MMLDVVDVSGIFLGFVLALLFNAVLWGVKLLLKYMNKPLPYDNAAENDIDDFEEIPFN